MPPTTGIPAGTPRSSATAFCEQPHHRRRRHQVGELGAIDAEQAQQIGVVVDAREVAVVGDPVQHDRVERGRAPAGQLEVEPVLRLEVLPRRARERRLRAPEPEDVRDRVLARERGCAAGELDPRAQLARVVALHAYAAAGGPLGVVGAAGVHPDDRVVERLAVAVDRHRARPLRRDRDGHDVVRSHRAARHGALRRGHDPLPPRVGGLLGAAVGQQLQLDRREVAVDERAVHREERDLRARGPEIDGEDVLGHHAVASARRRSEGPVSRREPHT